jgi:hypothetical protein
MLNVVKGSSGGIKNADANGQFDVTEAEWSTEEVGGCRLGMFARVVEVEEANDIGHINDGVK